MKIIVVDDELVSRKKLQKIMDTLGESEAVENGEDSLKIATSENPPDLILLDIMMPGIDGYEVCRRLKADKQTSRQADIKHTGNFHIGTKRTRKRGQRTWARCARLHHKAF